MSRKAVGGSSRPGSSPTGTLDTSAGSQSDDVTIVILRRRLTSLAAELRGLADEILGAERAVFWDELAPVGSDDVEAWLAAMPELLKQAQARFGRGLARELTQQLRLTIEDYRGVNQGACVTDFPFSVESFVV